MDKALKIMRESAVKNETGIGWNLFDNANVTSAFHGIWYVQDIVDFLLTTQTYMLATQQQQLQGSSQQQDRKIKWDTFTQLQTYTDLGLYVDKMRAQLYIDQKYTSKVTALTEQEQREVSCYTKLMKETYCSQKYNYFVIRSSKKKQNDKTAEALYMNTPFYPASKIEAKTTHGFFYVLQGVADEMLNALFSLFCRKMEAKSASMRIKWQEASNNHIKIAPILKTLKLIRRDIDARVTDRKSFKISAKDNWYEQTGIRHKGNFFPHSSLSQTLNARILVSMHNTLRWIFWGT